MADFIDASIFKNFSISAHPNKIIISDLTVENGQIKVSPNNMITIYLDNLNAWLKVFNNFYFSKNFDPKEIHEIIFENNYVIKFSVKDDVLNVFHETTQFSFFLKRGDYKIFMKLMSHNILLSLCLPQQAVFCFYEILEFYISLNEPPKEIFKKINNMTNLELYLHVKSSCTTFQLENCAYVNYIILQRVKPFLSILFKLQTYYDNE